MASATRAERRESLDWRQVAGLGDQLLSEHSLSAQHEQIVSMTSRLIAGNVDVWLHEDVFRLPDWDSKRIFPPQPPLDGMRLAIRNRHPYLRKVNRKGASRRTFIAIPLEDQGFVLGAIQATRPKGPNFRPEDIDLLEGLARIVA
jgi:hypothetical protein